MSTHNLNTVLLWTKKSTQLFIIKRTQKKNVSFALYIHDLSQFFPLVRCLKRYGKTENGLEKNQEVKNKKEKR